MAVKADGIILSEVQNDTHGLSALKTLIDAISAGSTASIKTGTCDSGMSGSTTTIVSDDLTGYGDDYFNTDWEMHIIQNDNSHTNAPEGEVKDITDYVSSTGTFTTAAFSENVEENDEIFIVKVDSRAQTNYDDLMDKLNAMVFPEGFALEAEDDTVSSASETALTDPATITITYPTGASKKQIILVANVVAANQSVAEHNIGLTLQYNYNAGGWTDVGAHYVFTTSPPLVLPAIDASQASFTTQADITSIVAASGNTITFRWQADSDNAGEVHYVSNFAVMCYYDFGG